MAIALGDYLGCFGEGSMKSFLTKFRRVASWAIICAGIGLAGTSTAQAQFFFGGAFGALCGAPNTPPAAIHVTDAGGLRLLTPIMNTTLLLENENGLRKLQHKMVLKMVHSNGNTVWSRTLSVKSQGLFVPNPPGFMPGVFFQPDSTVSPIFPFNSECMGLGVAEKSGTSYITVALGTAAANGNPTAGEDKSTINVWVLDRNSGAVLKVFRPRPKVNRYLLPFTSGVFDVDNDGDSELLLVYGIFVGNDRYDFVYEYYDLLTGTLENRVRTSQFNRLIIK
jgi:hypothetical protein